MIETKKPKAPFLEIAQESFELIFQAVAITNDETLPLRIMKALYSEMYEDVEPTNLSDVESLVYKSVSDATKRRYDAWLRKTSNIREHNPRSKQTEEEPQITVNNG